MIEETLALISIGEITRAEAAKRLGKSTRTINRLMRKYGIRRPAGKRKLRHLAFQARLALRKECQSLTVPEIINQTGVSERTAYRWKRG